MIMRKVSVDYQIRDVGNVKAIETFSGMILIAEEAERIEKV